MRYAAVANLVDCVQLLQRLLAEEPHVELAVSFGSRASDVDLGVRFAAGVSPSERVALAIRAEAPTGIATLREFFAAVAAASRA